MEGVFLPIPVPVGDSTSLTSSFIPFSQQNVRILLWLYVEVYFYAIDNDKQESNTVVLH